MSKYHFQKPANIRNNLATKGVVYIGQCEAKSRLVKIGFSANLGRRVEQLRREHGRDFRVIVSARGRIVHETMLHQVLKDLANPGDDRSWYRLQYPIPLLIKAMRGKQFYWSKCRTFLERAEIEVSFDFEDICRRNFMKIIRVFARAKGIQLAAVSRWIYGKSDFLGAFERGDTSMSIKNFSNALDKLANNWPKNASWPFLPAMLFADPKPVHKGKIPRKG